MTTDEPTQLTDWREERRLSAWELKQAGWRQRDIAETLGVTEGAVSQWIKRVREKGVSDLRRKAASGAPRRLRDDQLTYILNLLSKGADQYGFCGETWTYKRVADLIQREFKVSYSERHVGRLLKKGCAGNFKGGLNDGSSNPAGKERRADGPDRGRRETDDDCH